MAEGHDGEHRVCQIDCEVSTLLKSQMIASAVRSSELTGMADRNLVQGLGVIQNTVIQSVAATADDAQLMASMNAANQK